MTMTPTTTITDTARGATVRWQLDPSHTHVEFAVKHLMISTVKGRFGTVLGTLDMRGDDPATARIDITIDAAGIDTREDRRDAHLRSADFLDAAQYPEIAFRSTRVERAAGADLRVTGDLTIRGVTRPVTLAVRSGGRATTPWGSDVAAFNATTKISRKDWGLTWNQALETGGVVVGDEIKISIEAELIRQG
jgi:polyisoprenoid-binding protein YceI